MSSGPVVCMAWEGMGAVKTGRVMLGETNPSASLPGTIRGDFCIHVGRNIWYVGFSPSPPPPPFAGLVVAVNCTSDADCKSCPSHRCVPLPSSFLSHGSDSVEAAQNEIALWFTESELNAWAPASNPWIYE